MSKNYPAITPRLPPRLENYIKKLAVMQGFAELAKGATAEGALSTKTKELIALAFAAARCDGYRLPCKTLVTGRNQRGILETLGMAVYMGGGLHLCTPQKHWKLTNSLKCLMMKSLNREYWELIGNSLGCLVSYCQVCSTYTGFKDDDSRSLFSNLWCQCLSLIGIW